MWRSTSHWKGCTPWQSRKYFMNLINPIFRLLFKLIPVQFVLRFFKYWFSYRRSLLRSVILLIPKCYREVSKWQVFKSCLLWIVVIRVKVGADSFLIQKKQWLSKTMNKEINIFSIELHVLDDWVGRPHRGDRNPPVFQVNKWFYDFLH